MWGLCNSNNGNPKTMGCSTILIILNDRTHVNLFRTTLIGSDSSTIFPEAMGQPSMNITEVGQGIFLRISYELGQNSYP